MAVTAPWTEDFEGPTFSGTNTFDPCWRAVPASTLGVYSWWLETYNTGYFGTGPSADHTTGIPGTGKYIYTLAVWGSTGDQVEVRTPFIDISGITNPTLRFWKHFHGAGIGSFFVEVDTGSGFQTIYATHGPGPQTASADPWVEEVLSLNAFSGSTALQIRFRAISGGYLGDLALDDISVDVGPSCFKPSAISVVSVDTNDVTLDWVPSSGISWEVAYGAPRFNPDAAVGSPNGPIGIVPASTHPFTVTGLTASTAYHFYVREACVAVPGVSSEWRGFASALTNCASAVTAAPWTEDFESPNFALSNIFDPCWTTIPASGPVYSWWVETRYIKPYTGPSADHTTGVPGAGQYIYAHSSHGSVGDQAEILTPLIDISGITNPELRFWKHFHGAHIDSFFVEVDAGSGFQKIYATYGPGPQTTSTDPWVGEVLNLNAFAGSIALQIRFRAICGGFASSLALDDISVGSCLLMATADNAAPDALMANITGGTPPYSYLWNTGDMTPTITGLASGTYTVTVTDANGCSDMAQGHIIGMEELHFARHISLYPNPTAEEVFIDYDFTSEVDLEVTVVNQLGQVVLTISELNAVSGQLRLEVAKWANGVYNVLFSNGSQINSRQLMIQR